MDIALPGNKLERFRVNPATLKFVDRVPQQTRVTKARPTLKAVELIERIANVQRQNLQRLEDDIAKLTKYLKDEGAPKAMIDALRH